MERRRHPLRHVEDGVHGRAQHRSRADLTGHRTDRVTALLGRDEDCTERVVEVVRHGIARALRLGLFLDSRHDSFQDGLVLLDGDVVQHDTEALSHSVSRDHFVCVLQHRTGWSHVVADLGRTLLAHLRTGTLGRVDPVVRGARLRVQRLEIVVQVLEYAELLGSLGLSLHRLVRVLPRRALLATAEVLQGYAQLGDLLDHVVEAGQVILYLADPLTVPRLAHPLSVRHQTCGTLADVQSDPAVDVRGPLAGSTSSFCCHLRQRLTYEVLVRHYLLDLAVHGG